MNQEMEDIICKYGGVCRECGPYSLQASDFRVRYSDYEDQELKKWFKAVSMFVAGSNVISGNSNEPIDDITTYFEEFKGILDSVNGVLENRVIDKNSQK